MRGHSRRLRLSELGESALVARLGRLLPADPIWVRLGCGSDDVAVLEIRNRRLALLTCDTQVEGQHFRRGWMTPRTLGRRAATVNLSDIAAVGGVPRAALVSLLLPENLDVRWFDGIMRGLGDRLAEFGARVVGGNLARSARDIVVDVSLLGFARAAGPVRRQGARAGDAILVTGWPGESAAGLSLLRSGRFPPPIARKRGATSASRRARTAPRAADVRRAVRRHLDPTPRLREGSVLARGGVSSMIDVSDGLATDLARLCRSSRVGAEIDLERLPVSAMLARVGGALRFPASRWVLDGGEDYELLCTAPRDRVERLQRRVAELGVPLHEIGQVIPRSGLWLRGSGRRTALARRGFDHFRRGRDRPA